MYKTGLSKMWEAICFIVSEGKKVNILHAP